MKFRYIMVDALPWSTNLVTLLSLSDMSTHEMPSFYPLSHDGSFEQDYTASLTPRQFPLQSGHSYGEHFYE